MFKEISQKQKENFKMNKYLYDFKEIINFLIQNNFFKIYLFHQKKPIITLITKMYILIMPFFMKK
ncbi:hypothetical protein M8044_000125 [Columbia Basin potato purple top phytoplasma]|uniref:Uncharacterized protein n=1 Tax=Columbia Basin potato purple top phytoplasma TaxID=307134 RepID=A0ABT5L9M0_9MOLU|nr:hypothetical protein [Columbia Basin potato purple top phytoplasma]